MVLEGISRGFTSVNIRKIVVEAGRLEDLVDLGAMTPVCGTFPPTPVS